MVIIIHIIIPDSSVHLHFAFPCSKVEQQRLFTTLLRNNCKRQTGHSLRQNCDLENARCLSCPKMPKRDWNWSWIWWKRVYIMVTCRSWFIWDGRTDLTGDHSHSALQISSGITNGNGVFVLYLVCGCLLWINVK